MVRYGLGLTMVAVAAAAIGTPAARAASSAVTCGETITQSVTLKKGLGCPTTPALRIGAAGVTVNLNGSTISTPPGGDGKPLIVDDGYASVTIENGTLYPGDEPDLGLIDASDVQLIDLTATTNGIPLTISGGNGDVVTDSYFEGNESPTISGSDDLKLTGDTFIGGGNPNLLTLTKVSGATLDSDDIGAQGMSVKGSQDLITNSTLASIEVISGSKDSIEGNQIGVSSLGVKIDAPAAGAQVRSNTVDADQPIDVAGPNAQIIGNTVEGPSDGIEASGSGALITDNTANNTDANGIEVSGPRAHVIGNTTDGNQENGIDISDPTAVIKDNTADDNTLYGIAATPGDTGKSNTATANNSGGQQCLNIECEAGPS